LIRNKDKIKDKRIKGKFVSMIIRNYVVFSVFLVILLFLIVTFVIMNVDKYSVNTKIGDLAKEYSTLSTEHYSDVKAFKYIGLGGFVEVVDSSNKVVYSSKPNKTGITYKDDELKLIHRYNLYFITDVNAIKGKKHNKKLYYIDRIGYGGKYNEDVKYNEVDIVGKNNDIIYSSQFPDKWQYTKTEYMILTDTVKGGYDVSKASFTDKKGNKYTLVVYSKESFAANLGRARRAFILLGVGFAIVYVLMLMLFGIWMTRKVNKPLKALESGMQDVSSGKTGSQIDYKGPKEFVDMCDSFNSMSTALYNSEVENQRLTAENQKLISDISHDLKTPITVIQGYAKAICDGMVDSSEQEKYLQIIANKSESLVELIDEFHDYSKMNHPSYTFDMREADICEYTREYFAERFDELEIAGYNLSVDIPEISLITRIDIVKFKRVYDNLISNFMKYNKPGNTFFCKIGYDERSITLKLGDDGIGIAKNIKESIFTPFIKGEASRTTSGSGLGLSIVKRIVEAHGGTIELVEKPERGIKTEFLIRLLRL